MRALFAAAQLIAWANPGCVGRTEQHPAAASVVETSEPLPRAVESAGGPDGEPVSEPTTFDMDFTQSVDAQLQSHAGQAHAGSAPERPAEHEAADDETQVDHEIHAAQTEALQEAEELPEEEPGTGPLPGTVGTAPTALAAVPNEAFIEATTAAVLEPPSAVVAHGPLPMYGAIVLQRVKDYDTWRAEFDAQLPERKRAGFVAQGVMRGVEEAQLVAVWLAVTDVAQADAFFNDKQLRARMTKAGVLAPPQVRLSSNVAARMEPGRSDLTVALVAVRVEDFSRFKAAFDSQAEQRAATGVVGYSLGLDVKDPQRVFLYLQAESVEPLQRYLKLARQRWVDAGLHGNPVLTVVREGELNICE